MRNLKVRDICLIFHTGPFDIRFALPPLCPACLWYGTKFNLVNAWFLDIHLIYGIKLESTKCSFMIN